MELAVSIVSDLVGKLSGYLARSPAENIAFYFGGKEKLNKLELTMKMIQARLHDAAIFSEYEDGAQIKLWLQGLRNVLELLEDLFEEASADEQNDEIASSKQTQSRCFCIPKLDHLKKNKMVNTNGDAIMEQLDRLNSHMHNLPSRVRSVQEQPVSNGRETGSFVPEQEVIGRDEDKKEIVRMLLAQDGVGENVSVIPIVGMGGIGKTALIQLVYNDRDVQQHFELRRWVCISDISTFLELARKVLKSLTNNDCQEGSRDIIESSLQRAVNDKRYLLVLDDVWVENRQSWLDLKPLFYGGKLGSKIIVTSRSETVAKNMGTVDPYELKGLTESDSWVLFERLAFREEHKTNRIFSEIGTDVVKKCANVPLAIRAIAGILYSMDTVEEWVHLNNSNTLVEQTTNKVMAILKLSYDRLPPHLKRCFAYCSLFPKDYKFDKKKLICLWMSQGLVEALDPNQSPYDAVHVYFMQLLRRCFFQDVQKNQYGVIEKCKMHDLMHDLACKVADECITVDRHAHFEFMDVDDNGEWKAPSWLLDSQVRSLLLSHKVSVNCSITEINKILSGMRSLRALDFGGCIFDSLPNSIRTMKHSRYLRISGSADLPNWITELQYLQTLGLVPPSNNIEMPPGFGKLTSLESLNLFVVGGK